MTEMSQRKKPRFQILFYAKLHSAAVTHIRCKTSLVALERHHVGAEASQLVRLLVRLLRNLNLSAEAIVKNYKLNINFCQNGVYYMGRDKSSARVEIFCPLPQILNPLCTRKNLKNLAHSAGLPIPHPPHTVSVPNMNLSL